MQTILAVIPLKPGKLQAFKAFTAEITGPRKVEYADLLKRFGLKNAKVFYYPMDGKEFIGVLHDGEPDAIQRLKKFETSPHPFDQWFVSQLADLYIYTAEEEIYAKPLYSFECDREVI